MSVKYSRALSLILTGATLMAMSMATVGAGSVDERTSGDKLHRANAERRSIVNQILNRWEPLAAQSGGHYAAWREVFASQLDTFDFEVLLRLNDLKLSEDPRASYTRIEQVMRGAQVRAVEVARKAPAFALKFGSTTSDQVFVPIHMGPLEKEATVITIRIVIGTEEALAEQSARPLHSNRVPERPAARP